MIAKFKTLFQVSLTLFLFSPVAWSQDTSDYHGADEDYICDRGPSETKAYMNLYKNSDGSYSWSYFLEGDGSEEGPYNDRSSAFEDMLSTCVEDMNGKLVFSVWKRK